MFPWLLSKGSPWTYDNYPVVPRNFNDIMIMILEFLLSYDLDPSISLGHNNDPDFPEHDFG